MQGVRRAGLRRGPSGRDPDLRHQGSDRGRRRGLCALPGHLVLAAVFRALRADHRPGPARVLVLSEPQRRGDQGPPHDVPGRADDLRVRTVAERLYHLDPVALVLDSGPGSVRLSPWPPFGVRPADGRPGRSHARDLLGVLPRRVRRWPLPVYASAGDRPARRFAGSGLPGGGRRRSAVAPGHVGRDSRATEIPGRRDVAGGRVRGHPLASGDPDGAAA